MIHTPNCCETSVTFRPLSSFCSVLWAVISKFTLGILGSGDDKPRGPAWSEAQTYFGTLFPLVVFPLLFSPHLLPAVVSSNACYFRCVMEMGLSSIKKKLCDFVLKILKYMVSRTKTDFILTWKLEVYITILIYRIMIVLPTQFPEK